MLEVAENLSLFEAFEHHLATQGSAPRGLVRSVEDVHERRREAFRVAPRVGPARLPVDDGLSQATDGCRDHRNSAGKGLEW